MAYVFLKKRIMVCLPDYESWLICYDCKSLEVYCSCIPYKCRRNDRYWFNQRLKSEILNEQ
jgi:hypothetical protein